MNIFWMGEFSKNSLGPDIPNGQMYFRFLHSIFEVKLSHSMHASVCYTALKKLTKRCLKACTEIGRE